MIWTVALVYILIRSGYVQISWMPQLQGTASVKEKLDIKLILMWKPLYIRFTDVTNQLSKNCPTINCIVTQDQGLLPLADAVLFETELLNDMPNKTKRGQVWIFTHLEPPPLYKAKLHLFKANTVNWTMTYRRDSDIPFYYGVVRPRKEKKGHSVSNDHLQNKSRWIVWLVSNCNTPGKREEYSKKLQQYIPIDVIGKCGSNICPRDHPTCRLYLLNNIHRYYYAAENSNCRDYITEKAFWTSFNSIIPVVRGGGNYSLYFPKDSVIDVRDFSHPNFLARHLVSVANDMSLYAQYFKWKRQYIPKIYEEDGGMDNHYCQLCSRLHQQQKFQRIYHNISTWWFGDEERSGEFCRSTL